MSWLQGKTRQVAALEVDDDGDDLFGTSDEEEEEDFNLFDNKSKSKNPTTSKFNKAKSISEASTPPATMAYQHHHHTNPATPVLRSAVTGVFANTGKQDINGITNEGFIHGVLNGSVLLGHHNSITVYHHC
ncbi:hypothetical protein QN277_026866 [Acacia crassicarpa]|uniref:Uncharacterized protein n=1 Tax=Acacia crassicarpa TaxID=499986 RepID=A0AAE1JD28_9FABA|nr:hypothetical protein QN277_026866 [Acacia crassicarpa]